jgi:short-subunit dehydrogenase
LGELSQEDKEKSKKVLHPRRAAEIIVRGIERNRKRIYVGKDAKTMNFLYRLTPDFAVKMIYKKIQHNF